MIIYFIYLFIIISMFDFKFYRVVLYNTNYYIASKTIFNKKYDYGMLIMKHSIDTFLYFNTDINKYMNEYLGYFLI